MAVRPVFGMLLAVPLAACSSAETDTSAIEQDIETEIHDRFPTTLITVDCPNQVEWETGEEFHCIAEDSQGRTSRVTVTMENEDGEVTWVVE